MERLTAERVISGGRLGSSRPVRVATEAGEQLVKLRGAAQGTGALVAEVVVAAIAGAIGLRVPARSVVRLDAATPTDDRNDELADLLAASVGENLGFPVLEGATDLTAAETATIDPGERAAVLWLDRFVLNPDRTARNPNLLRWKGQLWLIDHGAALRFQYDWSAVWESTPREIGAMRDPHLFEADAAASDWAARDEQYARAITRDVLEAAVGEVPDSFLLPLLAPAPNDPPHRRAERLRRRRAAYVAFLWKRVRAPRAFALASPRLEAPPRRPPPAWVTKR